MSGFERRIRAAKDWHTRAPLDWFGGTIEEATVNFLMNLTMDIEAEIVYDIYEFGVFKSNLGTKSGNLTLTGQGLEWALRCLFDRFQDGDELSIGFVGAQWDNSNPPWNPAISDTGTEAFNYPLASWLTVIGGGFPTPVGPAIQDFATEPGSSISGTNPATFTVSKQTEVRMPAPGQPEGEIYGHYLTATKVLRAESDQLIGYIEYDSSQIIPNYAVASAERLRTTVNFTMNVCNEDSPNGPVFECLQRLLEGVELVGGERVQLGLIEVDGFTGYAETDTFASHPGWVDNDQDFNKSISPITFSIAGDNLSANAAHVELWEIDDMEGDLVEFDARGVWLHILVGNDRLLMTDSFSRNISIVAGTEITVNFDVTMTNK